MISDGPQFLLSQFAVNFGILIRNDLADVHADFLIEAVLLQDSEEALAQRLGGFRSVADEVRRVFDRTADERRAPILAEGAFGAFNVIIRAVVRQIGICVC